MLWTTDIIRNYTIPYHTIPYHTIPYHTIPYHTIPYHTIPYHTIPYHTIPYPNPSVVQIRGQYIYHDPRISCRWVHCPPQHHGLQHQVHKGARARWHTTLHRHLQTMTGYTSHCVTQTHTHRPICKRQLQSSPPTQYVGGAYAHEASISHGHPPPLVAEGRRWLTSKTPWRPIVTNIGCSRSRDPSNNRELHLQGPGIQLVLECRTCRAPPRHSHVCSKHIGGHLPSAH